MKNPTDTGVEPVSEWLQQAVRDVSETMFALEALPASPATGDAGADQLLVACIGIRGDRQLEVAMSFPKQLADHLAGISLGMPAAELDDKILEDVAGEFSNMVVGAVKSRFSDLGVPCTMTVPRVVRYGPGVQETRQKVQAALAVIRGSAGPRDQASATPTFLGFQLDGNLLNIHLYF